VRSSTFPLSHLRALVALAAALSCSALIPAVTAAAPEPPPSSTRFVYAAGKIVPIPASIPHEAGDMVDRRILPDLRWIAARYPIYVTDGYSGPLPDGEHVGCDECHVRNSDHYNGVAVDLVPIHDTTTCDANWAPITRLASGPSRFRTSRSNRSAGSATKATPATAAATTSTFPGITRRRRDFSSPNGSKCSRSAPPKANRGRAASGHR
jgi:hypothetical protein